MFPRVETLSRLTESLEVTVFELFRPGLVPKDNKEMIYRFQEDMAKNVTLAVAEVIKVYMG